jgi:hypothetical protein
MTEQVAFDDTGGLLFIFLIGLSATIGVVITQILGIDGPGAVPLLIAVMVGVPTLISLIWFCVIFDPFGARELLEGEE